MHDSLEKIKVADFVAHTLETGEIVLKIYQTISLFVCLVKSPQIRYIHMQFFTDHMWRTYTRTIDFAHE